MSDENSVWRLRFVDATYAPLFQPYSGNLRFQAFKSQCFILMKNTYQCKSKIYYPFTLNLNIYATITLEISSKNSELAEILQAPPRKVLAEIDLNKALGNGSEHNKRGACPPPPARTKNRTNQTRGTRPLQKPGAPNGAAA
ncbi:hypothetical protein [Rothia mucilaginosa]|uniref:hypothetical protein n=1 Tax=Rothia mucilaginosa TaxID=43675 RepID=UPI0028E1F867|nr:hypothetical protein [Rothia mucilaginosa]